MFDASSNGRGADAAKITRFKASWPKTSKSNRRFPHNYLFDFEVFGHEALSYFVFAVGLGWNQQSFSMRRRTGGGPMPQKYTV